MMELFMNPISFGAITCHPPTRKTEPDRNERRSPYVLSRNPGVHAFVTGGDKQLLFTLARHNPDSQEHSYLRSLLTELLMNKHSLRGSSIEDIRKCAETIKQHQGKLLQESNELGIAFAELNKLHGINTQDASEALTTACQAIQELINTPNQQTFNQSVAALNEAIMFTAHVENAYKQKILQIAERQQDGIIADLQKRNKVRGWIQRLLGAGIW
jgi:hypothetical protein